MRCQSLEEPQVVLVEGSEALIAVETDEGSESPFPAGEWHDEGTPEFPEDGVSVRSAFVVSRRAQEQARLVVVYGSGDDRRVVDDRSFHRRADFAAQCDVPHRGPFVDDDQLRPVRPHDRLHLLQHRPGRSCGLEVGATHRPGEVVELLEGAETIGEAQVAPVGEDDQGADGDERQHRPGVPPGCVEHDKGEGDVEISTRATVVNSNPYLRCWGRPVRRTTIVTARWP